ncbi:MAG: cation:proton antiporter [Victivallaceae bacterium]|nr:cation:proton antiporter [Victivallaceae bacterium]
MTTETSVAGALAVLAIQLGVILIAARLCGKLAEKCRIPSVLGELLAGVLIGPYCLGSLALGPELFPHGLFPLPGPGASLSVSLPLYAIATLGSITLLFMSGLETDLKMFFRYSLAGTLVGTGGVIVSFLFGAGLGLAMYHSDFTDPRVLFLGILSTATSVGITARILSEKKSIDSPEGTTILSAAVIDDVLGIICLAVVIGLVDGGKNHSGAVNWGQIGIIAVKSISIWLGATAVGLIFAHRIARWLKWFGSSRVFGMAGFALALIVGGLFEEVGLAMIVGAYVMGLCLSKTDVSFGIQRVLAGVYDFLVPVFFVVMGMLVDVRVMTDRDVLFYGILFSILAVLAKIIGCALPAWCLNFNLRGAVRIGMGMIPRGEVALIIAGIGATTMMTLNGKQVPIIDSKLFGVAIIMTLVTTLAAPPLLAMMLAAKGAGVRKPHPEEGSTHTLYVFGSEILSDLVLRAALQNFRQEGFRHSAIDREGGLTRFVRESTAFALRINGNNFDFESGHDDVPLIRSVMYETLTELHYSLSKLQLLASPEEYACSNSTGTAHKPSAKSRKEIDPHLAHELEKVLLPGMVIADLHAKNIPDAAAELLQPAARAGKLKHPEQCLADILSREKIASTCVGSGIAFPHARTTGVGKLICLVGISRQGIPGAAPDDQPIHLVVLTLAPEKCDTPYLEFMGRIASRLHDRQFRTELLDETDAEAIRDRLLYG